MISIGQLSSSLQRELRALEIGDGFGLRTYKGDRGISIKRTKEGFVLEEDGFFHTSTLYLDEKLLLKDAKRACKREFPRSHRLQLIRHRKEG